MYKFKETGRKRNFTGLVTTKTNTECSSHLVLCVQNQKYFVKYCVRHSSHNTESRFLRVSDATKDNIEEKLRNGVSSKDVLDAIRKEYDVGFSASKYCSKKTVENIIAKLGIGKEYIMNKCDALSVDSLVEEDNGKSFFLYKPMGVLDDQYPKATVEDFMLGFMCEKQREVLISCMENPTSTLCIDSTHGTNAYQIKLTTLLTVNSLGIGVPVAFFFTTKEDEDVIGYFLSGVKQLVGQLRPKVFMSDGAAAYWNAFKSVMGEQGTKRLLCVWHVDKNWRKSLVSIKDDVLKAKVYKKLCLIRMQPDPQLCNTMIKNFLKEYLDDIRTKTFAKYFQSNYCSKLEY